MTLKKIDFLEREWMNPRIFPINFVSFRRPSNADKPLE